MRLQSGPLHVGWRGREHLVYSSMCVQPSGGAFDLRATLSPIPPLIEAQSQATRSSPVLYHPPF